MMSLPPPTVSTVILKLGEDIYHDLDDVISKLLADNKLATNTATSLILDIDICGLLSNSSIYSAQGINSPRLPLSQKPFNALMRLCMWGVGVARFWM